MARVVVIGGHGKVARHLARILSARADEVTAVIRNPEHTSDVEIVGATAVVADVENLDTPALAEVLRGHDAVVWSAGAGGGDPARTYAVDRDAAIRSMDACALAGVDRYLMVSYLGARTDHGVPPDNSFFAYAEAKAAADAYLRETALAWTILGPSTLTLEPGTGLIETGPDLTSRTVSREDVALVAAETLTRPHTAGKFIAFNNGDIPIGEALDSVR
ncbi:SDR family oxidoreductase [Rhodococcus spelaei]|uniref:SDR family oxidoreductase n=1 Tax=Rhodococcus spelaei TaxID=2546320 RepID=A0A541BRQ5_9NOCA|nr:SDR family oxidoreductase [Rhodococcus spelaei]TQF75014.1 SDR family oxidoreductase [Rhodococcus spelaei]